MTADSFRFERFVLDPRDRRLTRDGAPVALNARYLDALALLVREQGRLVTKDRFLDEVWRGVPVTDEALTQCIRTLRKALGDDAVRPRFIETAPKHGYRFIAAVEVAAGATARAAGGSPTGRSPVARAMLLGVAGTVGAAAAGAIGGLFYGFVGAAQPAQPGVGAASVLLVLFCLTVLMATIGGAGVAFGVALAGLGRDRPGWRSVAGGALGGLIVGAVVKLLGLDAFNLLFGGSPGDITGAFEGVLLGGAVGLGAWLAGRPGTSIARGMAMAGAVTAAAGGLIPLLGGRMMGGSLDLLARGFPGSRFRLDLIGGVFGETGLGLVSQMATGGLEGLLFGAGIVGALAHGRRRLVGLATP